MNPTLSYLLGRRMWWISGVGVWGELADFEPEFIMTQTDGASKRIVHAKFAIGGAAQVVRFDELTDIRGNKLPTTLSSPRVLAVPKGESNVIVRGQESAESFLLAKQSASSSVTVVDLLIIEMG